MQSQFYIYFSMGFDHIVSRSAYDHIAFLIVLCAIYRVESWRKILILITAFTIGHCITLILGALHWIAPPHVLIERIMIPATIISTAIFNVTRPEERSGSGTFVPRRYEPLFSAELQLQYGFALLFGLIHGMAFSQTLAQIMTGNLFLPLLSFNLGIELGQLVILGCILGVSYWVFNVMQWRQRSWTLFVSGAAFGIGMVMWLGK
jgi:HupE / UreJ protein